MEHGMEWIESGPAPDGFTLFSLKGDCDLYNAPRFMRAMTEALAAGLSKARIDCAGLRYLDSTGVGAIVKILQAAKLKGAEVRFAGLSGSPRKVLQLCNVISLMKEERTVTQP
jgi:anti-sigma B factor antagonist